MYYLSLSTGCEMGPGGRSDLAAAGYHNAGRKADLLYY